MPRQEALNLPTFNVNGISYVPLISICQQKNINWDYDSFLRKISLKKQNTEINLIVGSHVFLVNGNLMNLTRPVEFYKGIIVVPYEFYQKTQRYFEV
ncbi:MAG: stalk domain-containing protein, partial [Candidatus Omnitrophota bacterium]